LAKIRKKGDRQPRSPFLTRRDYSKRRGLATDRRPGQYTPDRFARTRHEVTFIAQRREGGANRSKFRFTLASLESSSMVAYTSHPDRLHQTRLLRGWKAAGQGWVIHGEVRSSRRTRRECRFERRVEFFRQSRSQTETVSSESCMPRQCERPTLRTGRGTFPRPRWREVSQAAQRSLACVGFLWKADRS